MVIDLPLYTLTLTATPSADAVTLTIVCLHKFDPRPGGVLDPAAYGSSYVVANGQGNPSQFPLISSWGAPYPPHTVAADVWSGWQITQTYTVVRSAVPFLVPPGDATFHFKIFTSSGLGHDIAHADLVVALPARPLPALASGKILRSLFMARPDGVQAQGQIQVFRDAGINAFECNVFANPGDNNTIVTQQQARDYWTANALPNLQLARSLGFYIVGIGDDFFRNSAEKAWVNNTSWAADHVAWVGTQLAAFADIMPAIEMQDESPDTASDPSYQTVINALRSAWPTIPLGWPNQNFSGAVMANEQPSRATYASRFVAYDGVLPNLAASTGELAFRYGPSSATGNVPAGWPLVLDLSVAGDNYTKGGPGGDYNPATDTLLKGGITPEQVVAQVWVALAYGCCALRAYLWESDASAAARATAPVGSTFQTGTHHGDARFAALSAAYTSVAPREAKLLAGYQTPQARGNFLVGVRDELAWAVNLSTGAEQWPQGRWRLVTPAGEVAFGGGSVPSGGVVISADPEVPGGPGGPRRGGAAAGRHPAGASVAGRGGAFAVRG